MDEDQADDAVEWLAVEPDEVKALREAGFEDLGDVFDASDGALLQVINAASLKKIRDQLGQE